MIWETGLALPDPALAPADIKLDQAAVQARGKKKTGFGLAAAWVNPQDLRQAGWGVVFAQGASSETRDALAELLDFRRKEAGGSYEEGGLYAEFSGVKGYKPGLTARQWLEAKGVGPGEVNPVDGVPLYLLLIGDPDEIPFDFQYELDSYWCVGRLSFPTASDYAAYAMAVVEAERAGPGYHARKAALFATRNDGDRATGFFHNQVAKVLAAGNAKYKPLETINKFQVQSALAEEATRQELLNLLQGKTSAGKPSLLITGSHGAFSTDGDPAVRRARAGALVTQEWKGAGAPLTPDTCVTGADVQALPLDVRGMVHFFFACYSAGCPQNDTYTRLPDGSPKPLLDRTIVAALPLQLLRSGALAIIGHIDRAFSTAFQISTLGPQIQGLYGVLYQLLNGVRVGQSMDAMNLRWCGLATELSQRQADQPPNPDLMRRLVLMRDEARNYVILGDPAVRLLL